MGLFEFDIILLIETTYRSAVDGHSHIAHCRGRQWLDECDLHDDGCCGVQFAAG